MKYWMGFLMMCNFCYMISSKGITKTAISTFSMKIKKNHIESSLPSSVLNSNLWKYQPRTNNQIKYVDYLTNPNISIVGGFGPAGSGKTLFACHAGVSALKSGSVDKIVITRPLISVDEEELGFLPGTIANKMDPWTRPIFDILGEFYTVGQIQSMVDNGVIEISPLAYMRGRTFKRAFVIADEMQNSSPNQMLMMLTRIGEDSKLVITGDLKQSDRSGMNGLFDFIQKLRSYNTSSLIKFIELDTLDIQRSPVVACVLDIYSSAPLLIENEKNEKNEKNDCVANVNVRPKKRVLDSDAAIIPKGYHPSSYTL